MPPLKNAKEKGARQELRCKHYLELNGYRATKAGGSLGEWDIIAISRHMTLLCQVKSNIWPNPAERKKLEEFETPWGMYKTMWRYDNHARKPRIKIWVNPEGPFKWYEITGLPEPVVSPDGELMMQFYFVNPPHGVPELEPGQIDGEMFREIKRQLSQRVVQMQEHVDKEGKFPNLPGPEWPSEL